MVRFGLLPDARSGPVAVGQGVQVLPSQDHFHGIYLHLRDWKLDQRCRPEFRDGHCGESHSRSWRLGHRAWGVHNLCFCCRACEKSYLHGIHWHVIRNRRCRWAAHRRCPHRLGDLEVVSEDHCTSLHLYCNPRTSDHSSTFIHDTLIRLNLTR